LSRHWRNRVGKVRRQAPKAAAAHTVFRVGEVHGLPSERAKHIAELLSVRRLCAFELRHPDLQLR
jgi:hypothetical protein